MSITELPQVEELEQDDELEQIPTLPSEPATRREVLLRAAELMEEHGYQQGDLGCKDEGFCILGAVWHAGMELGSFVSGTTESIYNWSGKIVGVEDPARAFGWSDSLDDGWHGSDKDAPEKEVSGVLRRLADGKTWKEVVGREWEED